METASSYSGDLEYATKGRNKTGNKILVPGVQTTGYSPFQILFGREMKLPIDVSLLPQENIIKAPKQHIEDILKKLSITRLCFKTTYCPSI
jgi:hypothetical protein